MITATEQLDYMNINRPTWLTATGYAKGDYVTQSSTVYECLIAHTSGTFATDLTNGYWTASHFIQSSIDYAISKVNGALNRDCRSASYTDEFSPEASLVVYYPKNPKLSAISTIKKLNTDTGDWETIFTGDDTPTNSAKIVNGALMLLKGYTLYKGSTYQIVYTGGLASGDKDLERVKGVTKEIAGLYYKKSYIGGGLLGLTSRNMAGQGTESAGFDLDGAVKSALEGIIDLRMVNI